MPKIPADQVSHQVGAAGRAAPHKDQAQAGAAEHAAEQSCQHQVTLVRWKQPGSQVDRHRGNHCSCKGLKYKSKVYLEYAPDKQRYVKNKDGGTDRGAEQIINHCCQSGQSPRRDIVGSGKHVHRYSKQKTAG